MKKFYKQGSEKKTIFWFLVDFIRLHEYHASQSNDEVQTQQMNAGDRHCAKKDDGTLK